MMWKPVVVGLDGSAESVRAAVIGGLIARRSGARCTLIAAIPDYGGMLAASKADPEPHETPGSLTARDRSLLAGSLRGFVADSLIDTLELRPGRPADVLRARAEALDAGLIVLGCRRRKGFDRLRGPLASHLLRTSPIPLLVANGGAPVIQRILVALDLSNASEQTYLMARRWSRLFGARLRALHVVEPLPPLPARSMQAAEAYYAAEAELLQDGLWAGISDREAERVVRRGYAETIIPAEVTAWGADMLILGSHGGGWAERLLVGSTTEYLVQHPAIMTLVIPAALARDPDLGQVAQPWEEREGATARA